ncbi:hypothetical protein C7212DRAFT_342852 [Tuber magnatum]|uniref:Uncharacterized protein n=1 Tax=Tuber magnatum TaxID=42249 RepID=A0A317ST44_9PEZI|nr:hypothetical protein C7212DRAFT_342852 [Tuber magnatum]
MTATTEIFINTAEHLCAAADGIALAPILPVIQKGDQIIQLIGEIRADQQAIRAEIRSEIQAIRADQQAIRDDFKALEDQVRALNRHHDLLPLRLYNSTLRHDSTPIRYPPDIGKIPRPVTMGDLRNYTSENCKSLIEQLKLQEVPPGSRVNIFRDRIADCLGVTF